MGYASSSDVAALTPHLLSGASDFSTSTSPTLSIINTWVSAGSSLVNARIATMGYGAIPTNSAAYDFARQANALYAAWMAERSRMSARVSRDENTRADYFKRDFNDALNMLVGLDLSRMGVTKSNQPPANWAGGISATDKEANESDSDIVQPRFGRDQFRNRESLNPRQSSS